MALPIVEQITMNLAEALEGVKVVSGYGFDLEVERRKRSGNPPRPNLCVVCQLGADAEDGAAGFQQWVQHYALTAYAPGSERNNTDIDTTINRLRSDIEKALMVDPHRGSPAIAIDTIFEGAEQFQHTQTLLEGIDVLVAVRYDTLLGDPYNRS